MRRALLALATLAVAAQAAAQEADSPLQFSRVAVLVYGQSAEAKKLAASAQSRLESILLDNGVEITDRDQSSKIRSVWKKLEDPGYFVTADDFVKNAGGYGLDGVARIYLAVDVKEVLRGFFSATAQADVRLVDEDAKVNAHTSYPMGAPGRPPSDGLTAQAALVNAVQRAVDDAAQTLGLAVAEPASPRAVMFTLQGPAAAPAGAQPQPRAPRDLDADYVAHAQLQSGRNTSEEVTCADRAPGGDVAAIGGSLRAMTRGPRGLEMHHGSRVHLVDVKESREIGVFETQELGRKPKDHRGTSQVLDCLFVHSWRYLAAVTGDVLSLWDTERGLRLHEVLLPFGTDKAELSVLKAPEGLFLRVNGGGREAVYRIVPGAAKS